MRFKFHPRQIMAAGLLLVVLGLVLHHENLGIFGNDAVLGFLMGAGLGLELVAVIKLGRARRS